MHKNFTWLFVLTGVNLVLMSVASIFSMLLCTGIFATHFVLILLLVLADEFTKTG